MEYLLNGVSETTGSGSGVEVGVETGCSDGANSVSTTGTGPVGVGFGSSVPELHPAKTALNKKNRYKKVILFNRLCMAER
jgi:hypothetical protein